MQAQTFSRKKIIGIIFILGLLLALYFALKLARQAQDIRNRAAGTGDVLLTLDPVAKSAALGEAFNVKIVMKNNASTAKTISTAGVDLDFDPALFTVSAISCGSNFPSAAVSRVDTAAKKIYLTCFVGAGSPAYSMAAGSQTDLGSFTLTVGSSVAATSTDLSFARTNVADSVTYADLSNPGTKATYDVGVASNLTITPTLTPTPSTIITPTPSPTGGATVGLWHMDEASGNVVDSSGNGNTGTSNGTTVVAGKLGNARSFNGSTDYISIADSSSLNPSAITAETWIKTTDTGVSKSILGKASGCATSGYIMWLNENYVGAGKPGFFVGSWWVDANITINDGLWHYLVGTYDGTDAKIYVDGVLSNSASHPGANLSSTNPLQIGGSTYCGNAFNGTLDEVHISNYALSAAEILANYQAQNVTPTPSPTVVVSETPIPSLTPTGTLVPTITLTPTPPSGQEAYTIDIGDKNVLSINIGAGNTPQIKFTAKLAGAEGHPDMYFKLRAKDDLAFLNNPNAAPTCESPGAGGVDLYVPMKADNSGVYTPVTSINLPSPAGGIVAIVTSDGWVSLAGLSAGKYYTLNLKGPKTRGTQMLEHVLLAGGQDQNQIYDWTGNNLQLQPGDLPDPNNSNKQDCTVNSVDISLINSRLGKTDPDSLNIADVSYDGVVNANDIAQVVGTLSTKPDDDN